jgi:tRNA/tmRNA/rRNA uracil-C5-methylase (TrmA/RlmC/RlmD family)
VTCADDSVTVSVDRERIEGPAVVVHRVSGRDYRVAADGFWQVHPGAAETLQIAVMEGLSRVIPGPWDGLVAWDLFCGAGLFAGGLADRRAEVHGIETDREAVRWARRNVPEATFSAGRVEKLIGRLPQPDIVVADPARRGLGKALSQTIAKRHPRVIAYVACDPASLARDLATFALSGYHLKELRCFDAFPMTSHIESIAWLTPAIDAE